MKKLTITLGLLIALGLTSCYDFDREQQEKDAVTDGKSILFKAEFSKKAKVEQAKADFESAKLEAGTRIIEAVLMLRFRKCTLEAQKSLAQNIYV